MDVVTGTVCVELTNYTNKLISTELTFIGFFSLMAFLFIIVGIIALDFRPILVGLLVILGTYISYTKFEKAIQEAPIKFAKEHHIDVCNLLLLCKDKDTELESLYQKYCTK